MANTTAVYARIDTKLKDNAESILSQLVIAPTANGSEEESFKSNGIPLFSTIWL